MGTVFVVVLNPGIERLLSLFNGLEGPVEQKLFTKALVKALYLAGGGWGVNLRVPMRDAVFPTYSVKKYLDRVGTKNDR